MISSVPGSIPPRAQKWKASSSLRSDSGEISFRATCGSFPFVPQNTFFILWLPGCAAAATWWTRRTASQEPLNRDGSEKASHDRSAVLKPKQIHLLNREKGTLMEENKFLVAYDEPILVTGAAG